MDRVRDHRGSADTPEQGGVPAEETDAGGQVHRTTAPESRSAAPPRPPEEWLPTLAEQIAAAEAAIADGRERLLPLLRGLARRYRGPLRERLIEAGKGMVEEDRGAAEALRDVLAAIREGGRGSRGRKAAAPVRPADLPSDPLLAPTRTVRGVGPRLAERLARLGVVTLEDLALWPPRDYRDRRTETPLGALEPGRYQVTAGRVLRSRVFGPPWRRKLAATLGPPDPDDGTTELDLVWFRIYPGQLDRFAPGVRVRVAGTPRPYEDRLQIAHPEATFLDDAGNAEPAEPVVPVYPSVAGFDAKRLRKVVDAAVAAAAPAWASDPVPAALREARGLPGIHEAARRLHHPASWLGPEDGTERLVDDPAGPWRRLGYGEAFVLGAAVARARAAEASRPAAALSIGDADFARLAGRLGFEPTGAQRRAFGEVREDLGRTRPMRRLLQGDVGSGKTAVAAIAAAIAAASGRQAAILAPTEILADQHATRMARTFAAEGLRVVRLSAGLPARRRRAIEQGLALGTPQIVVGTHALLEDPVRLPRLGLVVVDEQQRFGVHQRFVLSRAKAEAAAPLPHLLVMTATPIPRTLALGLYGDLDVSRIDEMPPGRRPVATEQFGPEERDAAYARLVERVAAGERVYVVCPLVEPSEESPLASAVGVHEELSATLSPGAVALLHGRLLPEEKIAAIERFRRGDARVLVSTTVVEVGVDVPEATGVLIDGADRFGLSQLHQIRGRVGRAGGESWALLVRSTHADTAVARCRVLCETHDGFRIAEADLAMRGAGDPFGSRQSGTAALRFADPIRDAGTIAEAIADARRVTAGEIPLDEAERAALDAALTRFARSWGRPYDESAG
jgi:ATP-dependent DNA helicase RecG